MTKEKALYQVKLILEYLPEEEYKLIPQETLDYIENNFEYDENFSLNPDIPLEKQNINDKAYDFLEKVIKQAEKTQKALLESELNPCNITELIRKESEKLSQAKRICEEYKAECKKIEEEKDNEIAKLTRELDELKNELNKIPKFIRKLFIKENKLKMLE